MFRVITQLIVKEFHAQGHTLTGTAEQSLNFKLLKNTMQGFAVDYMMKVNEGIEPGDISAKMIPGLIRYFILRGYQQADAQRFALATFNKWKTEGMSTQASKRFSSTGGRHHFLEAAFLSPEIDNYMSITFDFAVDEEYHKTKSETI